MRTKKEMEKKVLFTTEITEEDLNVARECLEEDNIELDKREVTENDLWERANDDKQIELDDLEEVLAGIGIKGKAVAIADLGLWNGRHRGVKILNDSLDSIFQLLESYDDYEIYVDDKDLQIIGHHHDGTNYITIRSFKEKITEEQEDDFESLFYTEEGANKYQIGYYTESVRPLIAEYYGF